jgi:hypothetical protein
MDNDWFEELMKKEISIEDIEKDDFVPTKELLIKKISIEDAEWEYWGALEKRWLEMKQQIQSGDELWQFTTPPKTWEHLYGRAGIALVRQGRIINSIVTVMN